MRRFPSFLQLDSQDCGPTCIRIIAKHYGKTLSAQSLRKLCYVTNEGVSLLGISDAAEKIGFTTTALKLTWEHFRNCSQLPCIVHWNQNHFLVVYKITKRKGKWYVYVSDPSLGLTMYSEDLFLRSWIENGDSEQGMGIALVLEPTLKFFKNLKQEEQQFFFSLKQFKQYLIPHWKRLLVVFFSMTLASVLSLFLPFITQAIVDKGVAQNDLSIVKGLLLAQMCIMLGQLISGFLRNWFMTHTTIRISISLISDFLAKIMRLPLAFFSSKSTGDTLVRIQDHDRIQDFLTNSLLSILMASILVIVYGAILARYSIPIFLIFIFGSSLYFLWIILFLKKRRKLDQLRFQESAKSHNSIVQIIGGMQDIKLNNCEKQRQLEWEHIQSRLYKINIGGLVLSQSQQIGGTVIDQTKNIIISYMAAKSVIDGGMTLGMMMSITYILGQLNAPIIQFISFIRESQDAKISMERLGEIHSKENEESEKRAKIKTIPPNGTLEMKNVVFQYEGPHSAKVLNNISLRVPYGKVTAIVGSSGSGKTTLLKILLGIYSPIQGSVTLNGIDLHEFSGSSWRQVCGCVMQEGYIFNTTIAENIGLSDECVDLTRVQNAAKTANISEWIDQLPLGYHTVIGAEGHGLSVGQKQRILIARAAYKNAPYLFFDEATNSLDTNNEMMIMENLDSLFENKTVLLIAHRLSTVKSADNIIVLDKGCIVEEGSHLKLLLKRGVYYELVKNQLGLDA